MNPTIKKMRRAVNIIISTSILLAACSGGEQAPEGKDYLDISSNKLSFVSAGGVQIISVSSNMAFSAESDSEWCDAKILLSSKDNLKVTVSANSGQARTAEITITKGDVEKKVTVNQAAGSGEGQWDGSKWDEGDQSLTYIKHGIPAYGATKAEYRRSGNPILDVELQAPVVVAAATQPEAWGYFQFPAIYRSGVAPYPLVARWSYHADHPSEYGGKQGLMLSSDNGKTWNSSDNSAPFGLGLVLNSGYRINSHTPSSLNVNTLQLPQSLGTEKNSYGDTFRFYRLSELPAALQGVYLNRWNSTGQHTAVHGSLDDPGGVRYSTDNLFPVVWLGDMKQLSDNSIIAGMYPMFYESTDGSVPPSGVSFYRSTDDGSNWKIRGKIPYVPDTTVDPNGNRRKTFGFSEPAFEILSDGTFFCVMRADDGYGAGPMYYSRSSDQGVTWSQPKAFTPSGVQPKLLQLDNGVLVLASGRPGVQVRFSIDGKGQKWTDPFEMVPFTDGTYDTNVSCGYTQLLKTGPDSFLVIYSDFKYLNQNNEERKAIKVREIKVTKK